MSKYFLAIFVLTLHGLAGTAKQASARRGFPLEGTANDHLIDIPYGGHSRISYNLASGELAVYQGSKPVLTQIYAAVRFNGDSASSRNYTERTYYQQPVADGFGHGKKYVITLTGKGLPLLRQVFYTYAGKSFFITQLEMEGKKLRSNYMAPFIGQFKKITGDVRTMFVPFDNDTFISYNARPFTAGVTNTSSEVGTVYDNDSRNGIVAGSLEHGVWKTGIRVSAEPEGDRIQVWAGYTAEAVTRDSIAHGIVEGDVIQSPKMLIGCFDDWRAGLEEYGKANRIADPPYVFNWTKPTPVGWNSWGAMQDKLTYDKALKVAGFFADSLKLMRTDSTAYIDLDAYWDFLRKGDNYAALKEFVEYCKSKGLQPGVYWAPFTDWGWKGGPDRMVEGTNVTYGQIWTKVGAGYHDIDGARAIDPTHPATKARIKYFISRLKACGFKMIKIDFLGHGAAESTHFYDTTVTTGMQAYRKGMEYLIDQLGNQMFIYAAISPSLATGRYVHSRRIACDAFKTIEHTRYTLNSVTNGWWQTYLYNYVDADHVVLDHQTEGENRARMLSAVITGTFVSGDDFSVHGPWSDRARKWYQDPEFLTIIKNGKAFRPVEGNNGTSASAMFVREIGGYYYLAVFNYGKMEKKMVIDAQRIGLRATGSFRGTELFHKSSVTLNKRADITLSAADAMIIKFKAD